MASLPLEHGRTKQDGSHAVFRHLLSATQAKKNQHRSYTVNQDVLIPKAQAP